MNLRLKKSYPNSKQQCFLVAKNIRAKRDNSVCPGNSILSNDFRAFTPQKIHQQMSTNESFYEIIIRLLVISITKQKIHKKIAINFILCYVCSRDEKLVNIYMIYWLGKQTQSYLDNVFTLLPRFSLVPQKLIKLIEY